MSERIENIPVNGTQLEMFSAIVNEPELTKENVSKELALRRERQAETQLTVLSFGGGQDSWAILLMIVNDPKFRKTYAPKDLVVVMSDTGNEFPYTYEANKDARALCEKNNIPFFFLTNDMGYHTPGWMSLKANMTRNHSILSATMNRKPCTGSLKINPINKFMYQYMSKLYGYPEVIYTPGVRAPSKANYRMYEQQFNCKVRVIIGFARDEEMRAIKSVNGFNLLAKWTQQYIQYSYPLIEMGISRSDAQNIIKKHNSYLVPPSNCMICFYQSNEELVWLERNHPEEIEEWAKMEANKLKKFEHLGNKNNGIYGNITLSEKLEKAKLTISQDWKIPIGELTNEQLWEYKLSHGHCVKSSF